MAHKTYNAGLTFKAGDAGDAGAFRAVFATLGLVDKDGDLTLPGAFPVGRTVAVEGWNHDYGLPVGRAVIGADQKEAWVDGRFFLDTSGGRQTYEVVKGLGPAAEWSYTFRVLDSDQERRDGRTIRILKRLDVAGVAPVTRGAGVNTRTVAIKGAAAGGRRDAVLQGRIDDLARELAAGRRDAALTARLKGMLADLQGERLAAADAQLAALGQALGSAGGRTAPTPRDAIRARIVATYTDPDGPPSAAWVEHMVEIELAGLADQVAAGSLRGGVDPGVVAGEARAAVARWAGQAARA